ncbi:MAG: hypothetical protein ACKO3R_08860 [bacterium]
MPSKANLIQILKNELNQSSSEETQKWFESYLRGKHTKYLKNT